MLDYWYMNNLVRPALKPYSRNNLPQPWVGRLIAERNRECAPNPDIDLTEYKSWGQHLEHHLFDQIIQSHEDQVAQDTEVSLQTEAISQAEADIYLQSLDSEIQRYVPSPIHGHPDSDDEEYALQVEQEFIQLRAPPIEPGIIPYI